jgi:hypothetical protein
MLHPQRTDDSPAQDVRGGHEARVAYGWLTVWAWHREDNGSRSDGRCEYSCPCPDTATSQTADAILAREGWRHIRGASWRRRDGGQAVDVERTTANGV